MVTVDIIKDLFKGVVTSHLAGVSWRTNWNAALDQDSDGDYPACLWKPPSTGVVLGPVNVMYDTYTLDLLFIDDTEADRTPEQRDEAYERMEGIARQCFYRFRQLYILDSSSYQGVDIDLGVETSPILTAIWDEVGTMTTGCRMVFTIKNNIPTPCGDEYFS
jgi:hypothetical protein